MVNTEADALIVVPKTLRNTIKIKAAELGLSMRDYLKKLIEEKQ